MNKLLKNLFTLSCLVFALCLLPVSSFSADSGKIGVIDIQKVLNEAESGKKAKSDLENLIRSKQTVIDEKGKGIDKLKADLEKQSSVLSADARKTKEDELEKAVREYQRLIQDAQAEVKKKEGELTDAILKDVREIIDKMGATEGYSLIIEKGMVIFSDKSMDITDTVMKRYDESKSKSKK